LKIVICICLSIKFTLTSDIFTDADSDSTHKILFVVNAVFTILAVIVVGMAFWKLTKLSEELKVESQMEE
jgi:cytochrome oxidase assembly protein ShyY1